MPPLVGALLKNEQDVHLFEKLVFMQRAQPLMHAMRLQPVTLERTTRVRLEPLAPATTQLA